MILLRIRYNGSARLICDLNVEVPVIAISTLHQVDAILELDQIELASKNPRVDILALNEALDKLEMQDARKAALVKLRYFAGLTNSQAAEALDISTSTADNDWAYAKNWLRVEVLKNAID